MRDATSNDALSDFRSPGACTYNPNFVPDVTLTARSCLYQPVWRRLFTPVQKNPQKNKDGTPIPNIYFMKENIIFVVVVIIIVTVIISSSSSQSVCVLFPGPKQTTIWVKSLMFFKVKTALFMQTWFLTYRKTLPSCSKWKNLKNTKRVSRKTYDMHYDDCELFYYARNNKDDWIQCLQYKVCYHEKSELWFVCVTWWGMCFAEWGWRVILVFVHTWVFVLHELIRKLNKSHLFRFIFPKLFYLVCSVVSFWLLKSQIQIFTTFSIFKIYFLLKSEIWILC
jgi:hypothetical protein